MDTTIKNSCSVLPDITIRIINWNTHDFLEHCIDSLLQNIENITYEVIIVDNNSPIPGFHKIKEKYSYLENFFWIENKQNKGGLVDDETLPLIRGRYFLLLGPDTIVLPNSLDRMVEFLDKNLDAGAVSANLLNPDGSNQRYYFKFWDLPMFFFSTSYGMFIDKIVFKRKFNKYYFGDPINFNNITVIDQPAGACLMLRWCPPVVDYITDRNFPFYFGDVDLCKRIYKKGYKIYLLPTAEIIHYPSSSFKRANDDWKRDESYSSLLKYVQKYYPHQIHIFKFLNFIALFINRFHQKIPNKLKLYLKQTIEKL